MQNVKQAKYIVKQVSKLHKENTKIHNQRIKKDGYCIISNLPHTQKINELMNDFENLGYVWDKDAEKLLK